MATIADAVALYKERFGSEPEVAAFAPGRVNLIGEHTDYNDGFVLPFALPYKVIIVGSRSNSKLCKVFSSIEGLEPAVFEISSSISKGDPEWSNYIKGTVFQYLNELPVNFAFNALVVSSVPVGSGLSSSAALEVATATFLEGLCGIHDISGVEKALRCQKAEHTFAGTPCGIMDQYISAMGQVNNLLLIDCRSREFQLVPYGTTKADETNEIKELPVIVVTNSNVKHKLSGSEYPDRVKQCQEAVAALQTRYPEVKALRDASMEMVESLKDNMSDVVYRRACHCVSEDIRTLATVEALRNQDYAAVGRYMSESHYSLQHNYEVSGVYGSRMTGGGFGGCTVTLVQRSAVNALKEALYENYWKQAHLRCDCYEALPSAGAGMIDLTPFREEMTTTTTIKEIADESTAIVQCSESTASIFSFTTQCAAVNPGDGCHEVAEKKASTDSAAILSHDHPYLSIDWTDYLVPVTVAVLAIGVAAAAFVVKRKHC